MALTPQQLPALKAAILASPEASKLAVTNDSGKVPSAEARAADQAIADAMRAQGFGAASKAVPAWARQAHAHQARQVAGIALAAADPQHPAVEAAYAAVALADDARMDADFQDPSARPLLEALIATGLISSQDA